MCSMNVWWNSSTLTGSTLDWLFQNLHDQSQSPSSTSKKARCFFFFLLLSYVVSVRLALTSTCGCWVFLFFFFSIVCRCHFRNISLEPLSPQRSVAGILKGEKITYLHFLFSADIQSQQIITCLASVLPELRIIGLLLLDTIMVIIFFSKRLEGIQFRAPEGKAHSDRCIPPAGRQSQ